MKAPPLAGADRGEAPPVPIPNTEVKLTCGENTWLATARKNSYVPAPAELFKRKKQRRRFLSAGKSASFFFHPSPWKAFLSLSMGTKRVIREDSGLLQYADYEGFAFYGALNEKFLKEEPGRRTESSFMDGDD